MSAATLITIPAFGTVPATAQTQQAGTVQQAQSAQTALADRLTGRLGSRQAGAYIDGAGDLVVNVTTAAAARQVRDAGAKARVVRNGIGPLTDSKARLDRLAGTAGTVGLAWGVDVVSNAVVVSVPQDDDDAATRAFVKHARSLGRTVTIRRVAAAPRPQVGPGDAIISGGSRCSVSAIGVKGGTDYIVTAGHCTKAHASWTTRDDQTIGDRDTTSFPGNDYGTIKVSNGSLKNDNAQLTEVGRPAVGAQIQKKGSTTNTTTGTIRGYDRTVNYSEGSVSGLIETTACTQPGDSGGSLQAGNTAVGIVSGGSTGACRSGYQSYFQPLDEALQAAGLTLKKAGTPTLK
ncbi:alpha-lytic protease prodomain-containing protein [Actinomadura graeca]|uniref:Alpha-lytic protease prodomain-containing protein n=1 Tax=Actinomadura graeca TaxID=2750812 RepID=A0ABX8QTP4_9ACTN|nr:S1 family peptidase [Actinomadura graeca]QXJ22112.1 alpha-lytic protease prodomain-containing protein [Actinomadura graeca]